MWRSARAAGGPACSPETPAAGRVGIALPHAARPAVLRCWPWRQRRPPGAGVQTNRSVRAAKNVQLTRCGGRCMMTQLGIPDSCRRCPTSALSTQHSALSTQHSALSTQALSTQHSALPVDATGTSCSPPSPRHFQTEKQLTAPADRPVRDPAHALALTPAVALRGAGSVRRQTGMRTARALPGDRNRPLPTAGVAGHSDSLLGRAPYMRIPSDVYCRPETGSFRQASGGAPCGQKSQKKGVKMILKEPHERAACARANPASHTPRASSI